MTRVTRVIAACLAAAALAGVPVSRAAAATKVVITGGGWGHGLGLSQWGAYGRALDGHGPRRILRHYYTGTSVDRRNLPNDVRVGLLQAQGEIVLTSEAARAGGGRVTVSIKGSKPFASGGPSATWKVRPARRGAIYLYKNGNVVEREGDRTLGGGKPVVVKYEPYDSLLKVIDKNNLYRHGSMVLDSYGGSCVDGRFVRLVADIPMEDYVLGIAEVPASWPDAALRVQAIIARTYASHKINTSGQHRDICDCAVYDSTYDQVYAGEARRSAAGSYWDEWKNAVESTTGKIVLFEGAPILALYMSSSGGHTENNENVWGGTPIPYLRGVPDRADAVAANPNHTWRVAMRWSTFSSRLDAYFGTGRLQRFSLKKPYGVSGRVTVVKSADAGGARIQGSSRTVRASGNQVKSALGLKDTLFRVKVVD